jgi:DAHL domain
MRPSEIAAGVGVVCLLLGLLTWLLIRGVATDAAVYSTTLRILEDFALAEASLDRDVLQARAGLLTNYDPLVRSSEQIAAAVSQLRAQGAAEELDPGPVDRLAAAIKIEEGLTERFKSGNALLRNSLAYVGLLSISPGFNDRDPRLGAMAAAILQLTLDSSAHSQEVVQERLLALAVQPPVEVGDQRTAQPSFRTLACLRFFFRQSTTLSRGCSPFRPDSLWRRRARSSSNRTWPRNPRRNGFVCSSMRRPFYLRSRSSISGDASGPERSRCGSGRRSSV